MSLAHITVDIPDQLKALILELWTKRRLQLGGVVIEMPSERTTLEVDSYQIRVNPPLKVSGPLGPIRLSTTVTRICCDPDAGTITVDLNGSPIDVKLT